MQNLFPSHFHSALFPIKLKSFVKKAPQILQFLSKISIFKPCFFKSEYVSHSIAMIKVLFVCLGNICRSPLAEAIFNSKIQDGGVQNHFKSDSAGTSDYHIGELPDERTIKCAEKNNLRINHRGRQVHRTDFRDFHYIIAMDENNLKVLNELKLIYGYPDKKIYLMREFVKGSDGLSVPDPYYGEDKAFDEIYNILNECIEHFINEAVQTHQIYV